MRFDRLKDPAAMAAKDPGRYAIQGVAVVLRDGGAYLAATDGHALSLVRAHLDDTDKPDGVYPVSAFTAARKAAKKKAEAALQLNGCARVDGDGAATEFAKVAGTFPDLAGVVPTDKPVRVLRLDAALLARMQKALGADGVAIELHDDDRDRVPFVVRPIYTEGGTDDGSFGAMMPIGGGA